MMDSLKRNFTSRTRKRWISLFFVVLLFVFVYVFRYNILIHTIALQPARSWLPYQQRLELLWAHWQKRYIVALMNTNEKKPDGWFFWSFAVVHLWPRIFDIKLLDSYQPQTQKDVRVSLPAWFEPVLWIKDIGFLGANMIGFTDIDGKNIADIYDKTYNTSIDWVLFVKSTLFESLLPDFKKVTWRRQFQNASIDLIRDDYAPNKKELYFKDTNAIISPLWLIRMGMSFVVQQHTLLQSWYIRAYIKDANTDTTNRLLQKNLLTAIQSGRIFLFDYNLGFNKIDGFVKKSFVLSKDDWSFVLSWQTVTVWPLQAWSYTLELLYELNIPQEYNDFIFWLAKTYDIQLWQREKTILCIDPQFMNRWVVYLPKQSSDITINWDIFSDMQFTTPFWEWISYELVAKGWSFDKKVYIWFVVK